MTINKFIVFTNAMSGHEDEFNDWYNNQHLSDVLKVPGFVCAQRFKLAQEDSDLPGRYLAIYEIESADPDAAVAELLQRAGTKAMPVSPAMSNFCAVMFEPITKKMMAQ